jgi:hypothetical protein
MATQEQLNILSRGVRTWNAWRAENPGVKPDLSNARLAGAHLCNVNLKEVNLSRAMLRRANLKGADLTWADLYLTNFNGANLAGADLQGVNLYRTSLVGARLEGATLTYAVMSKANFSRANLTGCKVYGSAVWDIDLSGAVQKDLVITPDNTASITVDNVEVAQFIYLLLNNRRLRGVIDTIGRKSVLILGRFTAKRKAILDALREELRKKNFLPIIFDFDAPATNNLTETVSTLAHMSRFVIADITQAKSIPQELGRIVPMLPSVPVQPIIQSRAKTYAMFDDFYDWASVLPLFTYMGQEHLLTSLEAEVIAPATARANEIEKKRRERQQNQRRV